MRNHILTAVSVSVMLLSWPTFTLAQWSIVGPPPPWTSTSIQTTGGITYFLHCANLLACHRVETSPVVRSGTNLSFTAVESLWNGLCVYCYECYHTQDSATVLGDLAPGAYRLWIYSYPSYDPFDFSPGPLMPWMFRDFEVATNTGATLELAGNAQEIRVCLRGVPTATYVLESSTNLVQWTSVRTNVGGPCTFTNSVGAGEAQFFRTRVLSGSINTP